MLVVLGLKDSIFSTKSLGCIHPSLVLEGDPHVTRDINSLVTCRVTSVCK